MLRENLDTVLKDLLEFKSNENILSVYPGSRLDLDDNFLKQIPTETTPVVEKMYIDIIEVESGETLNKTKKEENRYDVNTKADKSEIVNRIRRYLDKKSRFLMKPMEKIKYEMQKYLHRNKVHEEAMKRNENLLKTLIDNKIGKRSIKDSQYFIGRKLFQSHREQNKHIIKRETTIADSVLLNDNKLHHKKIKDKDENVDASLKARFLFKSCMNYEILQKRGHRPLLDLLDLLGGWPILNSKWNSSQFDWLELMAKLRLYNNDILISEWVGPDIKNSDEFVIQFDQTSLGRRSYIFICISFE